MGNTLPTIWPSRQSSPDHFNYALQAVSHFGIPKPQSFEASARQCCVSPLILRALMRVTVEFNDQAFCRAEEVSDVRKNDCLTPKFIAI